MRYRAPFMDQALSALIEDVYARGLDRKVLIVAAGEFGRTPRLTHAAGLIGRDHWPDAQSALVSGGGLRMGQVIGATNRRGEYPGRAPADAARTCWRRSTGTWASTTAPSSATSRAARSRSSPKGSRSGS